MATKKQQPAVDYKKKYEQLRQDFADYVKSDETYKKFYEDAQKKLDEKSREVIRLKNIEEAYNDVMKDVEQIEKNHGLSIDAIANKLPMDFTMQAKNHRCEMQRLRASCTKKVKEAIKRVDKMRSAMIASAYVNSVMLEEFGIGPEIKASNIPEL